MAKNNHLGIAGLQEWDADSMPNDYGRWLIHGEQGSGKTTLASTIAALGQTLYIDLIGEKGVRSFYGTPQAANITTVRPTSITQLDDIFWKLDAGDHPYRAVIIDSLTAAQRMATRYLLGHDETAVREIGKGSAQSTWDTWGKSLNILVDIATFWYGLADANRRQPLHVVMTAQTKYLEDEVAGITYRTPDVQKGAQSIVLASADYILFCDVEQNEEALGDDTQPPVRFIVRFGKQIGYRTKARVPGHLRRKVPPILGRKSSPDLAKLSRVLGIGGAG